MQTYICKHHRIHAHTCISIQSPRVTASKPRLSLASMNLLNMEKVNRVQSEKMKEEERELYLSQKSTKGR